MVAFFTNALTMKGSVSQSDHNYQGIFSNLLMPWNISHCAFRASIFKPFKPFSWNFLDAIQEFIIFTCWPLLPGKLWVFPRLLSPLTSSLYSRDTSPSLFLCSPSLWRACIFQAALGYLTPTVKTEIWRLIVYSFPMPLYLLWLSSFQFGVISLCGIKFCIRYEIEAQDFFSCEALPLNLHPLLTRSYLPSTLWYTNMKN